MVYAQRLAAEAFFNTSGLAYKALNLKEWLPQMSEEEQLRPIAVSGEVFYIGFKAAEWEQLK